MSSGTTPKQGDHVFNDLEQAFIRPFETIRALQSPHVFGQNFLYDYLLHPYSLLKQAAETHALAEARTIAASQGAEEDALRSIQGFERRCYILGSWVGNSFPDGFSNLTVLGLACPHTLLPPLAPHAGVFKTSWTVVLSSMVQALTEGKKFTN
jgi:hypothetical protein